MTRSQCVLLLAHKLNVSGASTHMLNLGIGLQRKGWSVAVAARELAPGTPLGKEKFEEEGITVYEIPFPDFSDISDGVGKTLRDRGAVFAELNQVIRRGQPSVLHAHSATLVPFARAVGGWHRIPTITTLNFGRIKQENQRAVQWGAGCTGSILGHEVIAVSTEMQTRLVETMGLPSARVHRTAYAPNSDHFRPSSDEEARDARRSLDLENGVPVVSLIGLLEPRKGHDVLVRAVARLRDRGCPATALCAGSGSQRDTDRVRALAEQHDVTDQVRLLGHQDAREVMWASDVTVLPSVEGGDSFGLVVVESMLCGVPVIRTPAGGATDQIVDGESGYIVPFGDDEALADRLQRLLSDETHRREMGTAAEQRARSKYTKEQMASETIEVYESALQRFR